MIRVLLLLAVALPVSAQQQAQQAPADPAKAPERPALNLRLDNPSSFATVAPAPKEPPPKTLPNLGDDARKPAPVPSVGVGRTDTGPYPKDTNPTR